MEERYDVRTLFGMCVCSYLIATSTPRFNQLTIFGELKELLDDPFSSNVQSTWVCVCLSSEEQSLNFDATALFYFYFLCFSGSSATSCQLSYHPLTSHPVPALDSPTKTLLDSDQGCLPTPSKTQFLHATVSVTLFFFQSFVPVQFSSNFHVSSRMQPAIKFQAS